MNALEKMPVIRGKGLLAASREVLQRGKANDGQSTRPACKASSRVKGESR